MDKKQNTPERKTGYYGYQSESQSTGTSKPKAKKKTGSSKKGTILGIVLVLTQLILSIVFVWQLYIKNLAFVKDSYFAIIIGVLILLLALVFFLLQKGPNARTGGKFISGFVIIILALLLYLLIPLDASKFASGKKLTDKPFVVYLSAADTFGDFNAKELARTDTNILAVVHPKNHTVLMVSTPRDYYVPIQGEDIAPEREGSFMSYDKLTHSGLYGNGSAKLLTGGNATAADWNIGTDVKWNPGLKATMQTLKHLYNVPIKNNNYHYIKINFTGFAKLIDAMGGIKVKVDTPFSTKTYKYYDKVSPERQTYTYSKGIMEMNGNEALTFARERHSFAAGDMQRNKNQVKVVKAMEKKALSGNTLLHYTSILEAIEDCFATDMDISSSVNLLQDGSDGWNVLSFSVIGTPARQVCTYTGTSLSVVMQNEESVDRATNLIKMTLNGKSPKEIKKTIKSYNKAQAGQ